MSEAKCGERTRISPRSSGATPLHRSACFRLFFHHRSESAMFDDDATVECAIPLQPNSGLPEFGTLADRSRRYPTTAGAGQLHISKPYPKPRPRSGTTLVVLVGAGPGSPKNADAFFGVPPQTRPRSAFTGCEADPSLAVRTSIQQLMTAILSQRACGTRTGLKTRPYKLRDRDVLPVRGFRDACHMRLSCPLGPLGRGGAVGSISAKHLQFPAQEWHGACEPRS
jgi:hypothetical protein